MAEHKPRQENKQSIFIYKFGHDSNWHCGLVIFRQSHIAQPTSVDCISKQRHKEMNDFYKQPKLLQWIEALLLMVAGFYPALLIIEMGSNQPLFYLLFLIYLPIGQFTLTPIFRLCGIYKYYSPMLLGYMANNTQIDLHSGGSFDYLFVMRKFKAGIETRTRIFIFHLEGLMTIIKEVEAGAIPTSANIVGTSYFFNARTLNKFGFEMQKPSMFYRINLFVNFIDLV